LEEKETMYLKKTLEIGGREMTIETGELAKQADGSVIITYGDTVVLVTACMSRSRKNLPFLPLFCDYAEKTYSAGKIPGGFFKREGRPTETETLGCRLIDRPIRPLFPSGCRNELQVLATLLSFDKENPGSLLGLTGASAALMTSDIPWDGPVAALRIGRIDGTLVVNPTNSDLENSDLELVVAVGREGVVMVEGECNFVPEEIIAEALVFAEEKAQPLLKVQEEMAAELGITKREIQLPEEDEALEQLVFDKVAPGLKEALAIKVKLDRYAAIDTINSELMESLAEEYPDREDELYRYLDRAKKKVARGIMLETGLRIDGRKETDIRNISGRTAVLPRTHGSALFTRGETQALVVATLGSATDEQRIDALTGDYRKRFMLHYNFPPFSVGEVKPMRGPSRRDIGHGNLAERGVSRALPDHDDFPYTVRIVSEVLESNGSSSMATVCGASMALYDAGAPMKCAVGGIAMGLIEEGGKYFVLSDILGDEDHFGDMDFKVVGNREGVSAVQMDIKISGLPKEVLQRALLQAREARNHIIGEMEKIIAEPKPERSPYAPTITTIMINPEKIGALIGPGGKNIRSIVEQTGADINVDDDGRVAIAAVDKVAGDKAIELVRACTAEAEVGKIYTGKCVRVVDFGAFIQILPGIDGLCHISELSDRRVRSVEDVVKEGDEVLVKVINIDAKNGKVKLSRREALKS
jgi:polyribonucleotide nucleotidyltransferase